MPRFMRNADNIFWGALSLLVMLIVLVFMLKAVARYAPAPLDEGARTVSRWADPGSV